MPMQNALRITCAIVMLVSALAGGYWSFRLKEKLQDAIIAEKVSKTIAECVRATRPPGSWRGVCDSITLHSRAAQGEGPPRVWVLQEQRQLHSQPAGTPPQH